MGEDIVSIDYDAFGSSRSNAFRATPFNARTRAARGDVIAREIFPLAYSATETLYATKGYPYLTYIVPIAFTGQPWAPSLANFVGFAGTSGLDVWDPAGAVWSISDGDLPPGLVLTPGPLDGSVSINGTPTTAGSYPFTLLGENAEGLGEREFPFEVLNAISIPESAAILSGLLSLTGESGIWDGSMIPFGLTGGVPVYNANIAPDVGSSRFTVFLGIGSPTVGSNTILVHDTITGGGSNVVAWEKLGEAMPPIGTYAKTAGGAMFPDPITVNLIP